MREKMQSFVKLDKPVGHPGRDEGEAIGTENGSGVFRRQRGWHQA